MSTRSKVMGAALGGSTMTDVSVNGNSYGGDKKQGLVPLVGKQNWANRDIKINANGQNKTRQHVFCMNQLGGVGANRSQFNTGTSAARPDAVKYLSLSCNPPVYTTGVYTPENSRHIPRPKNKNGNRNLRNF